MAKSSKMGSACFAQGGPVIGKVSQFMKTPNEFSEADHGKGATDEVWGKGGGGQASGGSRPKVKLPKGKAR